MTIRPRKQFAQHWLRSDKALSQIICAAELSKDCRVLEIGPGTGNLTRLLLASAQSVVAVEIDQYLCEFLSQKFGQVENFLLLQADILSLNLNKALVPFSTFQKLNKVVANIPYNITGAILEKLLGTISQPAAEPLDLIVLLVQKEVAARLCAQPGSKVYGALSVRIQYLAACEWICNVPAKAFYPVPKVDSAVVRLRPHSGSVDNRQTLSAQDPRCMDTLIKLGFATRRKMLRNNLKSYVNRDRLTHLLEQLGIDPQARAEDLSVPQWVALSNLLTPTPCSPTL
ncbi:MAG TPA: 16S rRNA (adenine(1518)-N(6)/adenine(1519)-N(6))-dimethyltransferase RsmA [Candidatus Caenarcaniphilales bacterium]